MTDQKHFVVDTNVLIENPKCLKALQNGNENQIILPYTVLEELDSLKKDQRIAHLVSQTISMIETDPSIVLLKPLSNASHAATTHDNRILMEILEGHLENPILVTNDRIMRIKARLFDIQSESYRDANPFQSESQLYTGFVESDEAPPANSFQWKKGSPFFYDEHGPRPIDYQHQIRGVTPRNVYQNLALELMLNPGIDLTSIQSEAGYGKTFLALTAALHLILEVKSNPYRKIYLVKPVLEIGAKLGYLPGNLDDKMAPYIRYVHDLLVKLHEIRPAKRIFLNQDAEPVRLNPKKFEILPIAFIRGMNIENAVVIIDEMQNLSRNETRSLLTRMGEDVKCFCLGDTRQVDNPYLNASNNGLNWVVKKFKGMKNYGHMVLKGEKSRGPITDMVLKSGL
jgi:PhoH-like ATPase